MAKDINLAIAPAPAELNPEQEVTTSPTQDTPASNKPTAAADLNSYRRKARTFGTKDGEGKKQFVLFARTNVEGGKANVLTAGKGPSDTDHARLMYEDFTDASASASDNVTNNDPIKSEKSRRTQISKVRVFIRVGNKMPDHALDVFDRSVNVHRGLVKAGKADSLKYRSTYTAVNAIMVQQLKTKDPADPKRFVPLTDDAIKGLMVQEAKPDHVATGADLILNAVKLIDAAIAGRDATENRPGRDAITHPDLPLMRDGLYAIAQAVDPAAVEKMEAEKAEAARKKQEAAEAKIKKDLAKAEAARLRAEKAKQAAIAGETGVDTEGSDEDDVENMDVESMMDGEE